MFPPGRFCLPLRHPRSVSRDRKVSLRDVAGSPIDSFAFTRFSLPFLPNHSRQPLVGLKSVEAVVVSVFLRCLLLPDISVMDGHHRASAGSPRPVVFLQWCVCEFVLLFLDFFIVVAFEMADSWCTTVITPYLVGLACLPRRYRGLSLRLFVLSRSVTSDCDVVERCRIQ